GPGPRAWPQERRSVSHRRPHRRHLQVAGRVAHRLAGKVAIVTGAGSRGPGLGNGKAAAILFAREGARVLCVDVVKERADETVGLIRAEGGEAEAFAADVTRP